MAVRFVWWRPHLRAWTKMPSEQVPSSTHYLPDNTGNCWFEVCMNGFLFYPEKNGMMNFKCRTQLTCIFLDGSGTNRLRLEASSKATPIPDHRYVSGIASNFWNSKIPWSICISLSGSHHFIYFPQWNCDRLGEPLFSNSSTWLHAQELRPSGYLDGSRFG